MGCRAGRSFPRVRLQLGGYTPAEPPFDPTTARQLDVWIRARGAPRRRESRPGYSLRAVPWTRFLVTGPPTHGDTPSHGDTPTEVLIWTSVWETERPAA